MEVKNAQEKVMFQMLDMSTCHLRRKTLEKVRNQEIPGSSYEKTDNELGPLGAFVHIPPDIDESYPADLLECMKFAAASGADWIMFDYEGTFYKELPIYINGDIQLHCMMPTTTQRKKYNFVRPKIKEVRKHAGKNNCQRKENI